MADYSYMRKNALLLYAVILSCIPAAAQPLSLYDAVSKAIVYYPQMQQRQAEIAAGKAHIKTVRGNRLPSLILNEQTDMGTDNPLKGSYFSLGIVPATPGNYGPENNTLVAGNIAISFFKWDFFTFGYYKAQEQDARAQLAVSEAISVSDKYLLTGNIVSMYLDWLKKFRLLEVESRNVDRAKVILTAIRATVMSGLKPGVDSSTAEGILSEAKLSYLQALDNYNNAAISMENYTGSVPSIVPDTALFSQILRHIPAPEASNIVPDDHPLLDVYRKQYDLELANGSSISRKYMPHIGFDAAAWFRSTAISYDGQYPSEPSLSMPYSRTSYLFGLTLSYNLLDLRHRRDELAENDFMVQAKQRALQTRQMDLDRMMKQTNATYAITLEKLKELPIRLTSARQVYIQQAAMYKSGLNTLTEVTNAQYALLQAENSYVSAQDDLLQLIYMRAALSGRLTDFLQTFKR